MIPVEFRSIALAGVLSLTASHRGNGDYEPNFYVQGRLIGTALDLVIADSTNGHRGLDDLMRALYSEFNGYLASLGYRVTVDTIPAADTLGTRLPDLRIWAYPSRNGARMRVMISDPSSVWAKSGLHTGAELATFNGAQIDSFPDFRRAIRSVKLGDAVPVEIFRGRKRSSVSVYVTGYNRPRVRIFDAPNITPTQRERRRIWLAASPN